MYYDHSFKFGSDEESSELFYPTYSFGRSPDPITRQQEYFVAVGLNSSLQEFDRKRLNLVLLVDCSGSMNGPITKSNDQSKAQLIGR